MYPYTFKIHVFRADFNKWIEKNSLRKMSELLNDTISPSTLHRLSTGKKNEIGVQELCCICHIIGTTPLDYFDRVLF